MKYALIIPDGSADEPQESLGGRTPLAAADTPAMDAVAREGVVGRANNVPPSLPAGSDVACLSLLGYDPLEHFTGRAPLEAAAQGIELGPEDWAIRCNLVTVENQTMRDFTAGHISTEEARELLATVQEHLGSKVLQFYAGVSYRNLLVHRGKVVRKSGALHPSPPAPLPQGERGEEQTIRQGPRGEEQTIRQGARGEGKAIPQGERGELGATGSAVLKPPYSSDTRTTPPHDLTDKSVLDDYPRGPGSSLLSQLMSDSVGLFAEHSVNVQRRRAGKLPATNIWLWGQGRTPALRSFQTAYGKRGAMITAVDLLRGLAALIGWRRIEVPGATGYTDTDYAAKGRYAIEALSNPDTDLVCVHVEATDEASHEGDTAGKIRALEQIDRHIVAPLHAALKQQGNYRILISPDHPTPLRLKTHSHGAVPFALAGTGVTADLSSTYDEAAAARSSLAFEAGWKLMGYFLGK